LATWQTVDQQADDPTDDANDADGPGYLLTFPQSFVLSEDSPPETICMQIFGAGGVGELETSFWDARAIVNGSAAHSVTFEASTASELEDGVICKEVSLPLDTFKPGSSIVVKVQKSSFITIAIYFLCLLCQCIIVNNLWKVKFNHNVSFKYSAQICK